MDLNNDFLFSWVRWNPRHINCRVSKVWMNLEKCFCLVRIWWISIGESTCNAKLRRRWTIICLHKTAFFIWRCNKFWLRHIITCTSFVMTSGTKIYPSVENVWSNSTAIPRYKLQLRSGTFFSFKGYFSQTEVKQKKIGMTLNEKIHPLNKSGNM